MKNRLVILFCALIVSAPACCAAAQRVEITTSKEDTEYLWSVAKETWDCIDHFTAPETGFPYDTEQKSDITNTTNIGLYLASLSAATEMGFITREEAVKKADKILDSLGKLQNWKGFLPNWISVKGATKAEEGDSALSDFNKLPAGLMIVRQEFPELSDKCATLLNNMDWSIFYDRNTKTLRGGFNVAKKEFPDWGMNLLASDTRLAAFFIIANNGAPAEAWNTLKRDTDKYYGLEIIKPDWYGGGIFMQGICGLFLNERETVMGRSTADFAYAQMLYAKDMDAPVWGWSSSTSPWGDYLGWGGLRGNVITPHASVLSVIYYPKKVVENLRNLEKFGMRAPFEENGKKFSFGFRDAVDIDSKQVSYGYITSLDQGMLFLSLANYLEDGFVWKTFEKDPVVQNGKALLKDYFSPHPEYLELYANRDAGPVTLPKTKTVASELIPSGKMAADGCVLNPAADQYDSAHPSFLEINYDLTSLDAASFSEDLDSADLSDYNALAFYVKGDKDSKFTHSFRVELEGKDNGAVYKIIGVTGKWRRVVIPFREFGGKHTGWNGADSYWGGFMTDRSKMKKLNFVFDISQVSEGKGKLYIDKAGFESLDKYTLESEATALNDYPDSTIWKDGVIDDFETRAGWRTAQSKGAKMEVKIVRPGILHAIEISYDLGSKYQSRWVVIEKDMYFRLPDKYAFKFLVKVEGAENYLEFKLIDSDGSNFGKKIELAPTGGQWKEIRVESKDLSYLWGRGRKLDRIKRLAFGISTRSGGAGKVIIDKLSLVDYTRIALRPVNLPSTVH